MSLIRQNLLIRKGLRILPNENARILFYSLLKVFEISICQIPFPTPTASNFDIMASSFINAQNP
ncbi:hypothetical protein HI914_02300 [Erysiphe necator]|nr:hypothetical protein HI914_02300 [Erysiphe necator]